MRKAVIALVTWLAVGGFLPGTVPSVVRADGGLDVSSTSTYTVDGGTGVVHVVHDVTLTNTTPDKHQGASVTQYYFTSYVVPLPAGAVGLVATDDHGRTLRLDPKFVDGHDDYFVVTVELAKNLYYRQTEVLHVSYDLTGLPPRGNGPWRVNRAYAAFHAFGFGDDGHVTVQVVVPNTFTVERFGQDVQVSSGTGVTIYTAKDIADPQNFNLFVAARNDEALDDVEHTDRQGRDFLIRSWPGDTAWSDFVATQIDAGIPVLEALVGQPWPVPQLEVHEAYTPYFHGYGGWYTVDDDSIELGEDLDQLTVLHELSHAWFNDKWFTPRWLDEGFAEYVSGRAVERLGGSTTPPVAPTESDAGFVLLDDWGAPAVDSVSSDDDPTEAYGYLASHWVVDQIAEKIGDDGMRNVLDATAKHLNPYPGEGGAEPIGVDQTWRRFLDNVENQPNSNGVEKLFETWVLNDDEKVTLKARSDARANYDALVERGGEWAAPDEVRLAMSRWLFAVADDDMSEANAALDARDALATAAADLGTAVPANFEAEYQDGGDGVDLAQVRDAMQQQLDTTLAAGSARDRQDADHGVLDRLGLVGTDTTADLNTAMTALADGDLATARSAIARMDATLANAHRRGVIRLVWAGAALVLLLLVGIALVVFRRRRRLRAAHVDEDALTRTGEGGIDDRALIPLADDGEARPTAGIVEHQATIDDVGDAVLQLDEDVGTVVDTEPVTGAQVLIDPHAHDDER